MREEVAFSEAEMIAVYLRAEIDSARFGPAILTAPARDRRDRHIIDQPGLDDADENTNRRALLGEYRGYGRNAGYFQGFPADVRWTRAILTKDELTAVRYIRYDYWDELSGGTRLATDAARRIRAGVVVFGQSTAGYLALADTLRPDQPFPELILVAKDALAPLVVLEGHVRLTTAMLRPDLLPATLPVIIGFAEAIEQWGCY